MTFAVANSDSMIPLVGASGALSGVLGFYLVWFPHNKIKVFVWLFYFRTHSVSFKPLAMAMIIGELVSVAMYAGLYWDHQAAAFFLMPARIWELGIGALVFLASRRTQTDRMQIIFRRISPVALVALIVCFFVPEEHAMPATLAAVFLTGLLLASDDRSQSARLLTLAPVVYIGRISYSLYLWHWPIIALGPIVLATSWRSSAVYVVAMAIAAERLDPRAEILEVNHGRGRRFWLQWRMGLAAASNADGAQRQPNQDPPAISEVHRHDH